MASKLTKTNKLFILVLCLVLAFLYWSFVGNEYFYGIPRSLEYKRECLSLFKELNNPNPKQFYRPPLKEPPAELMKAFTQNGDMPITKYWYFNDVYSDSNKKDKEAKEVISKGQMDELKSTDGTSKHGYPDWYGPQSRLMAKYSSAIRDKKAVVIGTTQPWLEATCLNAGASKVTTLEFTRKEYEQKEILEWFHVQDYMNYLITNGKMEEFDNAVSYSSIEHTGLGRYGDPLDPNGDIKAVNQVHCMIKPGGLFFLGLPTSKDNSSYIEFNAHRVYGHKRLAKLFVGWDVLDETPRTQVHSVFVLRKKSIV
jgi:hypothetical protein